MNRLLRKGFILQLIGVVVTLSMTFSVGVALAEECAKQECPERAAMAESHIEFHCCLAEKAQAGDLITRTRREVLEAMGGMPSPDTWCEFWDTPILYAPPIYLGGEGVVYKRVCPDDGLEALAPTSYISREIRYEFPKSGHYIFSIM